MTTMDVGVIPGYSRRAYKCPGCGAITDRYCSLSEGQEAVLCLACGVHMRRYFGGPESLPGVNMGYRESRYASRADARIAQYQFENL